MIRIKDVVNVVKHTKPRTAAQFSIATGLALEYLGCGMYRKVYRILNSNLVIKFAGRSRECRKHSKTEANRIYEIMHRKKWRLLRRYMPKLYYFDFETGVTIMKYYVPTDYEDHRVREDTKWIQMLIEAVCSFNHLEGHEEGSIDWYSDIAGVNLGTDKDGNYKFLDMGLFETEDDLDNEGKGQRYALEARV